jgi:ribosomal protein S18 acetylase RimI-like enzyme
MAVFTTRALDEGSWPDFAKLVEKNRGVWGGCWCMGFHEQGFDGRGGAADNRCRKEALVKEGRAHAALVYEDGEAVGWCQFGSPEELPRIKNRKEYLSTLEVLPEWRITCFFVDKEARGRGVAAAALAGALREIAKLGGGLVESYPEEVEDRKVSSSFLHNATLALFEGQGFERKRRLGKNHWVVVRRVEPLAEA